VSPMARIRALVVDDSPSNRRSIADILSNASDVEVVGHAADGEEALRLVTQLKPDVVTLDLEMPKMDGFTFLRILMGRSPIPVIVISSYSQKENVFKALELGALDFVAKPDRARDPDLETLRAAVLSKVMLARGVRSPFTARKIIPDPAPAAAKPALQKPASAPGKAPVSAPGKAPAAAPVKAPAALAPQHLIAIASSTGGPSALMDVFAKIPRGYRNAVLVVQHMPENFTRTFAERLDRRGGVHVTEAREFDSVDAGTGFVCPGRQCMEVDSTPRGFRVKLRPPSDQDRYVPSADALFASVAKAAGPRAIGVVLTGMGDDGVRGAKHIVDAGGIIVAESEETAVVYGMPGAVVRAKLAKKTLPLLELADWLAGL
jgi:two-component system, chemotaxis family, protein-glutamate methylesterase/glutaminase